MSHFLIVGLAVSLWSRVLAWAVQKVICPGGLHEKDDKRQHQHAEALQSSTMHSLAKTVLETPKEGGCPLLPATSIASHQGGLPQATNKLINQGTGKQYIYSQWLQKNDILVYCYGIVPPPHTCTFYRRWISKGTEIFLSSDSYPRRCISDARF